MGKNSTCKYGIATINTKTHKIVNGCRQGPKLSDGIAEISEADCENCERYKSRYIEYPITVNKITNTEITYHTDDDIGKFCQIIPCNKEYHGKTYLGLYLGRVPIGISSSFNEETGELANSTFPNPAIYVFDLHKIIFGMESWWGIIESEEDLQNIEDTGSARYAEALKQANTSHVNK